MIHTISRLTLKEIERLLSPCLHWCSDLVDRKLPGLDVSKALRSQQLESLAKRVFPDSCHTTFSNELEMQFERFLRKRETLSQSKHLPAETVVDELKRGRSLLLTDWEASLFDGALTPDTDGFMDDDAMPPWDTWCALVKTKESVGEVCLLSWVPCWMSDKIDVAIQIDAAESLSWVKIFGEAKPEVTGWGMKWAA